MLVTLIIILILIWAAVIWSIYSNFLVFFSNFSESENYHKAYYASMSALERWELVTKQRSPWYVWSGWFVLGTWLGTISNGGSDGGLSWFSYLSDNADLSSIFWTVNSRTNRIPATSGWDVEWMLSAEDSPHYNMMWYENSEVFLLYYDEWEGNPYRLWNTGSSQTKSISGEIRLPKLLQYSWWFWSLDTSKSLVWEVWALPVDDAVVDWQIRGFVWNNPFTIYSTQSTSRSIVNYSFDSIFRENDINKPLKFKFWSSGRSPIIDSEAPLHAGSNSVNLRVISEAESTIESYSRRFRDVFENSEVSLRFSLLNLLKTTSGQYYPFLEYYVEFYDENWNPVVVSDKYYTINAEWNFKDFQINTIIQKPTVKQSVLWNFTSVF